MHKVHSVQAMLLLRIPTILLQNQGRQGRCYRSIGWNRNLGMFTAPGLPRKMARIKSLLMSDESQGQALETTVISANYYEKRNRSKEGL